MNLREAADNTVMREQRALRGGAPQQRPALKRTATPEAEAPQAAQGGLPDALAYVKSYHKIRVAAGSAGAALPIVLVIGGLVVERDVQTSLSAYYHTSMGDFFVTVLVVVGVLLMAYKLSDKTPDNRFGTLAGAAAFGVAFFPTARNLEKQPDADLSAIQRVLTEPWAQGIHFACAIAFIVLLARICTFFAEEELAKERKGVTSESQKIPSATWSHVHRLMAYTIYGALAFVALFLVLGWTHENTSFTFGQGNAVVDFLKTYCILLGEAAAVFAFGVSWFIKGLDFEILRADLAPADQP